MNVQTILVLMAALVKTRLADTFVSVLQVTREQTVKPVSNNIRNTNPEKPGLFPWKGGGGGGDPSYRPAEPLCEMSSRMRGL